MGEKGIVVADAASGESVATRDAIKVDDASNARVIQLMDTASRPVAYTSDTANAVRTGVYGTDSYDLEPLSSTLDNSKIDVSDCSHVVIWGTVAVGSGGTQSPSIVVTPIIVYDDAGTTKAATPLTPIRIRLCTPLNEHIAQADIYTSTIASGSNNHKNFIPVIFPTFGAKMMTFHIANWHNDGNKWGLNLFAAPTSMGESDYDIYSAKYNDKIGVVVFPSNN